MDKYLIIISVYGFVTAALASIVITATAKYHGAITFDNGTGVQQFHVSPTSRVGGIGIVAGYIAVFFTLDPPSRQIWMTVGLAGIPAFAFGLLEDTIHRVSAKVRLLATVASGLAFVLITGYSIEYVDLWGADMLLTVPLISVAFTVFAIGGIANAINIIDGFHGLASGTVMIILGCFAIVGCRTGDILIVEISIAMLAIVTGFFVINFPHGRLFLGDAGAYFLGFFVATLAIMLPARNPEVSPWLSLLILGYPLTETIVSIIRKVLRDGHHPGAADRVHLHMLVYRSFGRRLSQKFNSPQLRSALTSVIMWCFTLPTLLIVSISDYSTLSSVTFLGALVLIYIYIYRRVALLRGRT